MMEIFRLIGFGLIIYAIVVCLIEATLWLFRPDVSDLTNDGCYNCAARGKHPPKYCHKKYCRWYRKEK